MTTSGYSITSATRSDVPDLLAMIRALADFEKLSHLVVADEALLSESLFGARPAAEALIARESGGNGTPVGFALFFHTFSTFLGHRGLWLEDLFVYPAHRGKGLGRDLLVQLAGMARDRGCGRFEWSVLDWNTPAIGFYESLGAKLLPEWRIVRVVGPALDKLADT